MPSWGLLINKEITKQIKQPKECQKIFYKYFNPLFFSSLLLYLFWPLNNSLIYSQFYVPITHRIYEI